ncbi:Crp/Fnr family transcriptional regulator [Dehalobacter sp. DCM]|uniref:Crp/Fnr family transcriptional regulator n=1 Tax=Dehalobacter sp. DCM TaxID=2907827 RepID=UPI003081E983|nr:Crp/Fnr family transcriptional regulator [Dehalobacter sp. DCM]
MDEKLLTALNNCSLFDGISQEEMRGILHCMDIKMLDYRKNDFITIAGEPFSEIGIVVNGNIAATKETASGNRVLISILGIGDMFGEMAAYSGQLVWPMTVIAQTNCTVIYFPQDKIIGCCERVCVSHKRLILNMLKVVSLRALTLNRKVQYLSIKSLRGKISTYLFEEYNKKGSKTFQLNLNRNDLADFINVSRPSLSRELGKMRDDGIIDFHGSAIKIMDFDTLKAHCD